MMICRGNAQLGRKISCATSLVVALLTATWLGCGSGASTAPVSGKITYQGQPVTGGTLSFAPIAAAGAVNPGKPAAALIQSDGSFVLTTYTASDGAVIGKHRVTFSPPIAQMPAPKELGPGESAVPTPTPPSPYDGLVPKESEVEVKKGPNSLTIELVAATGAGQTGPGGPGQTPPGTPAPR